MNPNGLKLSNKLSIFLALISILLASSIQMIDVANAEVGTTYTMSGVRTTKIPFNVIAGQTLLISAVSAFKGIVGSCVARTSKGQKVANFLGGNGPGDGFYWGGDTYSYAVFTATATDQLILECKYLTREAEGGRLTLSQANLNESPVVSRLLVTKIKPGETVFFKFHAEANINQEFTVGAPLYGECYFTTTSGNRLDFYQTHFYFKPGEASSKKITFTSTGDYVIFCSYFDQVFGSGNLSIFGSTLDSDGTPYSSISFGRLSQTPIPIASKTKAIVKKKH